MGNWAVIITGIGPNHNDQPTDADQLVAKFTRELIEAGQKVHYASITYGGAEDLLGEKHGHAKNPIWPPNE